MWSTVSGFCLKLCLKKRWGFAIYRTDYSSGANRTKFLEMYERVSDQDHPSSDNQDGRDAKSWQRM